MNAMPLEVKVPEVGESVTEGLLVEWCRADGDWVELEEALLVIETDKITMTIEAEVSGQLKILVPEGATVQVGQVVGTIDPEAERQVAPAGEQPVAEVNEAPPAPEHLDSPPSPAPAAPLNPPAGMPQAAAKLEPLRGLSPAVQRMVVEHHLDAAAITGSGRDGRITKADVVRHVEEHRRPSGPAADPVSAAAPAAPIVADQAPAPAAIRDDAVERAAEHQTRAPMTPLRQRIAERLLTVQQSSAILTTFNEVDLSRVMALRARYKDSFKERHGIGLGFMSFFVKASIDALKTVPQVNTYLDGDEVVTNHYYDIGIAVSTDRGLLVPVLRGADRLSMAEVEAQIADYSRRAQDRTLELSELTGAVFTISNGGVFGSMLSTPILNPPGSAILGMHAIKKRPVVVDDEITVRPMMYLAVSYDHRVIDGREAVTFLRRIVACLENPERMLLEI
jgi:2-oxoglutarate dehydrogenase E2 component (dihydrolipoamide succinyltransferase)